MPLFILGCVKEKYRMNKIFHRYYTYSMFETKLFAKFFAPKNPHVEKKAGVATR